MDVVFEHSQHTHIIWPHFDLDLILNLDLFKWANFLVNPFWPFHLSLILLATKLWYLHGCCIWSFSTHPYHLTHFWLWNWPNFGLRLIHEPISWITHFDRIVSHHYCLLQNFDICMDVIFYYSPHTHITWPHFDLDLILNLDIFKLDNFYTILTVSSFIDTFCYKAFIYA